MNDTSKENIYELLQAEFSFVNKNQSELIEIAKA